MCDVDPLKQAVKDTCEGFTLGKHKKVQAMAIAIGSHPDYLRNKVNVSNPDKFISLNEARSMMLVSGDYRILHAIAHDCNHVAYHLPETEFPADSDLLDAWSNLEIDRGQTAEAIKDAINNGITGSRLSEVRREMLEDFAASLALLSVLEGMAEPENNVTEIKGVG